jgi:surface polysaccharide O-acyltransferase-like enzyme
MGQEMDQKVDSTAIPPTTKTQAITRLAGVDALRVLAAFMVVCIHALPFSHPAYEIGLFRPSEAILALCRAAVPFFFIASGYFFARSIESPEMAPRLLARQGRRLMLLFLAWCVIYFVVPPPQAILERRVIPHYVEHFQFLSQRIVEVPARVMEGTAFHLWFFTSLIFCLTWLTVVICRRWQSILLPVGIALFGLGLIASLDHSAPEHSGFLNSDFARYFLLGPLCVALGYEMTHRSLSTRVGYGLLLSGLAFLVLEVAIYFFVQGHAPLHDFVVSSIPVALGAMVIGLQRTSASWVIQVAKLAPMVLGIYVVHILIRQYLVMAFKFVPSTLFWGTFTAALVFAASLVAILVLRRIPGVRWLTL